jgi:hypothetical protein
MNSPDAAAALNKIAEIAKLAGIRGGIDDRGRFRATFRTGENRSQVVYVFPTRRVPAGQVVNIYSLCRMVKGGFLSGMSKEDALELLKLNEQVPFARYSIMEDDQGQILVMAGLDALLDTLDAAELNTYLWAVAMVAEAYEIKHEGKGKKDVF